MTDEKKEKKRVVSYLTDEGDALYRELQDDMGASGAEVIRRSIESLARERGVVVRDVVKMGESDE